MLGNLANERGRSVVRVPMHVVEGTLGGLEH